MSTEKEFYLLVDNKFKVVVRALGPLTEEQAKEDAHANFKARLAQSYEELLSIIEGVPTYHSSLIAISKAPSWLINRVVKEESFGLFNDWKLTVR